MSAGRVKLDQTGIEKRGTQRGNRGNTQKRNRVQFQHDVSYYDQWSTTC